MSSRIIRSTEPNKNSETALASSVLPVPVGPANRNTPIGLLGSFRPALSMAMRAIMASTASSWPITRAVKKSRIDLRSSCPWCRESRPAGRRIAIAFPAPGARRSAAGLLGAHRRELEQEQGRARQSAGAEILACGIERDLGAIGIELDMRPTIQFGDHLAHERQRRCWRQRLERDGFEKTAQRWLELQQPSGALGRRLAPHDQPAGGDRRRDLVEHGRALAGMPAAHGDLHDIGDVPDQLVPFRQFLDDLANAAFELADIDLIGLQIGAAGFEDAPVVGCQPLRQQPQERCLADKRLAGDQQRARRILAQRGLRRAQEPRASHPARPACRCHAGATRTGRPRSMSRKTWPVQPAPTASAKRRARG